MAIHTAALSDNWKKPLEDQKLENNHRIEALGSHPGRICLAHDMTQRVPVQKLPDAIKHLVLERSCKETVEQVGR
jgi:hypothetical protein